MEFTKIIKKEIGEMFNDSYKKSGYFEEEDFYAADKEYDLVLRYVASNGSNELFSIRFSDTKTFVQRLCSEFRNFDEEAFVSDELYAYESPSIQAMLSVILGGKSIKKELAVFSDELEEITKILSKKGEVI